MGFINKLLGKGQPGKPAPVAPSAPSTEPGPDDNMPRAELAQAGGNLAAGRKAEALKIYDSLIEAHPDSGDLLTEISSNLGQSGCLEEMIATIGPRYDAARHGAEAGLNLIQAHLHLGQPDGAQMWIDAITALDRPDLAYRLAGFAHAAADLRAAETVEVPTPTLPGQSESLINLVSISKPLWSYVLPETEDYLPAKQGRTRSIALLPLGAATVKGELLEPEHPANAWARGFPFAVAEALVFAPTWRPKAIVAIMPGNSLLTPPRGFGREQVRGLFRSGKDATDFALTGFLDVSGDQLGVQLEVIDVQRDRSLKTINASGPMAIPDVALSQAFAQIRQYLEAATVLPGSFDYAPPSPLDAHIVALHHAVAFFLVDKAVMPPDSLGDGPARAEALDIHASTAKDPLAPLLARGARTILERLQSS